MADHQLIDAYLIGLRRRLAWRPDVDDLLAEAEDHLLSSLDRLATDGHVDESAQRAVLTRFGDPTTVAGAHAATSSGGLAIPTTFTKRTGVVAIAAAGLWIAFAASRLTNEVVNDPVPALGLVALATLFAAGASSAVVVVGLNRRHGGLGPLGAIGITLMGLGVLATIFFWFTMGWGVLFAAGMLLVALAVHSRGLAPALATWAFGGAWAVGVITWSVLRTLEVGTRDQWGDFPIVSPTAICIGVAILVPGLVGLGRWLSSEAPGDLDSSNPVAMI